MSKFLGTKPPTLEEQAAIRTLRESEHPTYIYAEAVADERLRWWTRAYGLKESRASFCVHTLARGRRCRDILCRIPGEDHSRLFTHDGKPKVIVTEPYQIGNWDGSLDRLVEICRELALSIEIANDPGLWFPGRTISIVLMRKGESLEKRKKQGDASSTTPD